MLLIDTTFLETLSQREMRSGLAEMLKHGLIFDKAYWEKFLDLKTVDFILPKPRKMKISISADYILHHRESDLIKVKEIILSKYPKYKDDISKYLDTNNHFYQCNMMITSKQNWDDYHAWLFDILFELEKNITIPEDNFQRRIFGFLSERLFNLYILHNKFKIKEYPLLFITD